MAALEHVHRAKTEAQDVVLSSLARALTIALAIDKLFILTAFGFNLDTWHDAGSIMVDESVRADRCTNITLSNHEARWA